MCVCVCVRARARPSAYLSLSISLSFLFFFINSSVCLSANFFSHLSNSPFLYLFLPWSVKEDAEGAVEHQQAGGLAMEHGLAGQDVLHRHPHPPPPRLQRRPHCQRTQTPHTGQRHL